jgi:hypothetical protein
VARWQFSVTHGGGHKIDRQTDRQTDRQIGTPYIHTDIHLVIRQTDRERDTHHTPYTVVKREYSRTHTSSMSRSKLSPFTK